MKIVVNAFLVQGLLCYCWYFLQLMLVELLLIMFIHNGIEKKIHQMLNLILTKKQRFGRHINGKN